ncbi:adenosine deaminase [Mytilinidion resinicola]|uniref:Adenine deaminase n=1 Tax=Mytilinidion resinicola TaxID=574789 RepID=A0A6A6Z962_9PEZI|nr:adenosine deaminase [Mytilinidion resinicola]KAF2817249.1 adenosine deaminase [Mytilinidion resinicola]
MTSTSSVIAGLPKAELHLHIEGTLEPALVRQLASRNKIPIPAAISSLTSTSSGYTFNDLTSFLAVYYPNMAVLLTSTDFSDMAYAYLTKAHSQNVVHAEIFFDPQAHTSRGVPFSTVLAGLRQAIIKAERELGMSASLIMCFLRDMSPEFAMATLTEALPYKDYIVGVGLDSDERQNPPAKFAAVFARARQEGWLVTCHCDIDQQDSIEHIRQVLTEIQVDRIDHGTNIIEDPSLVQLVKERGIGLTCCPVSNSVVTEDFKGKEILQLLRTGVKVTVNSDDPAYFRGYMNENLTKMAEETDITREEIVQLQRNAFEVAWISERKREGFLKLLESHAK